MIPLAIILTCGAVGGMLIGISPLRLVAGIVSIYGALLVFSCL